MKKVFQRLARLFVIYVSWMTASGESILLQQIASNGVGKQYKHQEFSGVQEVLVTELEKRELTYIYEQTAEEEWRLSSKVGTTVSHFDLKVLRSATHHKTRLIDVREDASRLEFVLRYSQGYYYYMIDKQGDKLSLRAWVSIMQSEFLFGDAVDATVNSVSIPEWGKVVIKRQGKPDASYSPNFVTREVAGEWQGENDAYFKYIRN